MNADARKRLARELKAALARESGEQWAIGVDGGLGLAAQAAVAAMPRGPARAVEAARWVRRAHELGIDEVATLFLPGMSDDEVDALTELHCQLALQREREACE